MKDFGSATFNEIDTVLRNCYKQIDSAKHSTTTLYVLSISATLLVTGILFAFNGQEVLIKAKSVLGSKDGMIRVYGVLASLYAIVIGLYTVRRFKKARRATSGNNANVDTQITVMQKNEGDIFYNEAKYYSLWHRLSIISAFTILISLIYFVYFNVYNDEVFDVNNLLKFTPLAFPVYILFWVCINRANHYNQISVAYRHRARILDLVSIVPEKYDSVHEQVWQEMVSPLSVQTKDKTKQALKLLQEINKALPKKD
jgi:hypothetical protein